MNEIDVAIIGGGISGLHTAFELAKQGRSFQLFEARKRFGGRIYSPTSHHSNDTGFDIGPSWFWPGQTHIEKTIAELGLQNMVFPQYAKGHAIYEPVDKPIVYGVNGLSMQGSYRLRGGLNTLIQALVQGVQATRQNSLLLNAQVEVVRYEGDGKIYLKINDGSEYLANKVVLALPPRVALQTIKFIPGFSEQRVHELNNIQTWMAGHAKAVIIYEKAFWRDGGYSGDIFSQRGPLSEIHDASSPDGKSVALFGFIALQPSQRNIDQEQLIALITQQLTRLFGKHAAKPLDVLYKNWSSDEFTATQYDQEIQNHHPSNHWGNKTEQGYAASLIWSGTESADGLFNGYIEGALAASVKTLHELVS